MSGFGPSDNTTLFLGGNASNGVMTQLSTSGTMTALLSSTPTLSFWRFRYLQYTNFAMLQIAVQFEGAGFGSSSTAKIPRAGDLLYWTYMVFAIPGIRACPQDATCGPVQAFPYSLDANNPCAQTEVDYFQTYDNGASGWLYANYGSCGDYEADCAANACGTAGAALCDQPSWAIWTNAIGQFLVRKAQFQINQQSVDTLYNDFLFMWEELSGKPGKRLTEMIGKFYCLDDLKAFSNQARQLWVPLPFYFTQAPGNAFPLVSLGVASANVWVQLEQLQNCVVVSGPDVKVVKCNGTGVLTQNDLVAHLDTTQIYLDTLERDRFAATWFEQLSTQVSALYTNFNTGVGRIQLAFAYTCIELIWAIRRKCQSDANNWFNYTGILGKDPLVGAGLVFNSTERVATRNATYYRLVQPYQFHTNIPDACIYNYSFALYPEEAQPSGGACFSRLENIFLVLELQDGLEREDVTIIIFSRSYNVVKFREGVASVVFGS